MQNKKMLDLEIIIIIIYSLLACGSQLAGLIEDEGHRIHHSNCKTFDDDYQPRQKSYDVW